MKSSNLEWLFSIGPVNEKDIKLVENQVKFKFPNDFIECVIQHDGGTPSRDVYDFQGHREAVFSSLYSFNPNKANYILNIYNI